jgi:hypothetical protein
MAAGVVAAFAAINAVRGPSMEYWARLAMVAALGLPLLTALTLFVEQRGWTGIGRTALLAGGVLLLAGFYQVWPGPEETYQAIRYFQLSAALHLLVAFLPFLGRFQRDVFWQYNRRLFEAILRAVLFSGVLFLGLVIALAALDKLFGVDVPGETYARLWFVMALVANTWIFLGGVPDDLPALANDTDYPKGLKVLSQYILTPLVTIYLVLLTAYILKILITGDWPSGWIGYLVASVAVVGLLAFLLVAPLRDREGEGWIRTFSRWLFIGLMPAAVMFLLALWKRIDPYGLTELRRARFRHGPLAAGDRAVVHRPAERRNPPHSDLARHPAAGHAVRSDQHHQPVGCEPVAKNPVLADPRRRQYHDLDYRAGRDQLGAPFPAPAQCRGRDSGRAGQQGRRPGRPAAARRRES